MRIQSPAIHPETYELCPTIPNSHNGICRSPGICHYADLGFVDFGTENVPMVELYQDKPV